MRQSGYLRYRQGMSEPSTPSPTGDEGTPGDGNGGEGEGTGSGDLPGAVTSSTKDAAHRADAERLADESA